MDPIDLCTLLVILLPQTQGSGFDPCYSPKALQDSEYRGTQCLQKRSFICDRGSFTKEWYYVKVGESYKAMPEICPNKTACGTMAPIWMDEPHPSEQDEIVKRKVCVRGLEENDCCSAHDSIEVKNCGNFFVYNLHERTVCHEAYCFGHEPCPLHTKTTEGPISWPQSDPCNIATPINNARYRGRNCLMEELEAPLCDRVLKGEWFKADIYGIPLDMPQICVPIVSCGTMAPIWLNGSLPSFEDGIVTRQACVRGLRVDQCCEKMYEIQVRNCITHNVYHLPFTQLCDESYCFGMQPCLIEKSTTTPRIQDSDAARITPDSLLYALVIVLLTFVAVAVFYFIIKVIKVRIDRSKVNIQKSPDTCTAPPPPYSAK